MTLGRHRQLVGRLRELYPPGASLTSGVPANGPGCTAVEVRKTADQAVLIARFDRDPRLYGIPIPLTDTRHDYLYADHPVADDEEWLESVGVGLLVQLDTGLRARARRRVVGDYIELRDEGGWPADERFCLQQIAPEAEAGAESGLREVGLDPEPAVRCRAEGRLAAWLFACENNSAGQPDVGHVVVSRTGDSTAALEHLEITAGVPATVRLDLAYFAAHTAAAQGACAVHTGIADPDLHLVGFRGAGTWARVLDTSFLDADPDGARVLLAESLRSPSRWGQDRDRAGRYLPRTRLGRARHRLRYGATGARPRIDVG